MRISSLIIALTLLVPIVFVGGAGDVFAQESGPILDAAEQFENLTANDIVQMMLQIISWFLALLGVLAVIMALWASFLIMTAGGNEEQVNNGKKTLLWAIVGVLVAVLAFSIVSFTQSLFDAPPSSSEETETQTPEEEACGDCPENTFCDVTSGQCIPVI